MQGNANPTPLLCRTCHTRLPFASITTGHCPLCRGRNTRSSQFRSARTRAITAAGVEELIDDLCARLARQPQGVATGLIEDAEEFRARLRDWRLAAPSPAERTRTISEVAAWHARVWRLLEAR